MGQISNMGRSSQFLIPNSALTFPCINFPIVWDREDDEFASVPHSSLQWEAYESLSLLVSSHASGFMLPLSLSPSLSLSPICFPSSSSPLKDVQALTEYGATKEDEVDILEATLVLEDS
ncbi:hypothetical protein LIER_16103 [Lithospermum erythrorhizon]|uniref:Uncharacterized protein n=1 Tax=Lithospermum erythrorhizon TaxID=34254 RepID=A0AAV3Q5C0_LITER